MAGLLGTTELDDWVVLMRSIRQAPLCFEWNHSACWATGGSAATVRDLRCWAH